MPIDIDIAHVARLARIELDDDAREEYRQQCAAILEHAARVQALDTDGVPPTSHPVPFSNAFREDTVTPERVLDQAAALDQAPAREGVYFRVPPALEEE